MNELIEAVSQKTGMSQGVARTAVETVVTYLKAKLPLPVRGFIDSALKAGTEEMPKGLGEALGGSSSRK